MTMQHVRTYLEELKCKSSMEDGKALYSIGDDVALSQIWNFQVADVYLLVSVPRLARDY